MDKKTFDEHLLQHTKDSLSTLADAAAGLTPQNPIMIEDDHDFDIALSTLIPKKYLKRKRGDRKTPDEPAPKRPTPPSRYHPTSVAIDIILRYWIKQGIEHDKKIEWCLQESTRINRAVYRLTRLNTQYSVEVALGNDIPVLTCEDLLRFSKAPIQ